MGIPTAIIMPHNQLSSYFRIPVRAYEVIN